MTVQETERPFKPPLPRPPQQVWTATYRLRHRDLLAAIEEAIQHVAPDIGGRKWQYDGFGRKSVNFYHPCYGAPPVTVEFGVKVDGEDITLFVMSRNESELQLFRRLTTELDQQPAIVQNRIAPCTYQGLNSSRFVHLMF